MKTGDNVRIVPADLPDIPGELPYQKDARLLTLLGLKPGYLQHVGKCVSVEPNGDVVFRDWQNQVTVTIPAKHAAFEPNLDVNGVCLQVGDKVWLAVKNELRLGVYKGPSKWKHHGCGWCELGAQFTMDDGKKFSQFHPKGRVKA